MFTYPEDKWLNAASNPCPPGKVPSKTKGCIPENSVPYYFGDPKP